MKTIVTITLLLGLLGTLGLFWIDHDLGWFHLAVVVSSVLCITGILIGWPIPRMNVRLEAIWLAGGMWVGQAVEIGVSNFTTSTGSRLSLMFVGYAFLAISTYLVERRTANDKR